MAMACFFDQVRRDNAVYDTQHPTHDLGPAGKQETQLERETQHPLAHGLLGQKPRRLQLKATRCSA